MARLLRGTAEGAGIITAAHVVDGPDALAQQLRLSPARLAAFGWVSEMSAAEAAASLIDTYEGGWGLAILGDVSDAGQGNETVEAVFALGTPDTTLIRRYAGGADSVSTRRWVALRAMDLLRQQANAGLEVRS